MLNQVVDFLKEKPGYVKEGGVRLSNILNSRNIKTNPEECKEAIRVFLFKQRESARRVAKTLAPKILLLDIETAPINAYVWKMWKTDIYTDQVERDWYCLTWSAKWLYDDKVHSSKLTPEEAIIGDDKRILGDIWNLLDEANIVVGHNCVEVNTRVLKQDLTWVRAGDLNPGDKLVGFEEKTPPGSPVRKNNVWVGGKNRKILPSEVVNFKIEPKPCVEVLMSNGDRVITTKDHYWLGMAEKDKNQRWYKSESLRPGQRIRKYINVWDVDNSYEAGWLSGFISGEGTLKQSDASFGVDFYQRPGCTWNQAIDYCKRLNMPVSSDRTKRATGIGKQDTLTTGFIGGKYKVLENIGRLQIKRFINKINWNKFGGVCGQNSTEVIVVSVKDVGIKSVAVFSTTTKTFFADGYPMHNCDDFDLSKLNMRFLYHGLPPTSPYQTIDTLKILRKTFGFSSNKLDYIAKALGLPRKLDDGGFNTWIGCMKGDQESLDKMEKYNIGDVLTLEEIYTKIRPWIKSHPNVGLYMETESEVCPNCGGNHLEDVGTYYTQVGRYQAFRCECGAIGRRRINLVPKEQREHLTISIAK